MNILFWNLRGNPISEYVKRCLIENQVDIAVFAEHRGIDFQALEREMDGFHYEGGIGGPGKIVLFASSASVEVAKYDERYLLCRMEYAGSKYLLAGVHLQDRWTRPESQSAARMVIIRSLIEDVEALEASYKCDRTIIIGDLNANPYDKELLNADAFNAALFKDVIRREEYRTVDRIKYRRFYNPVLHYLSEDSRTYGSYYHSTDFASPVWHCLDQVLVRAPLMDQIADLQYLRKIGETDLISQVRPNAKISDHLPLLVELYHAERSN